QRVHAPAVGGRILGGQEAHAQQRFEVVLEQGLQPTLQRRGGAFQLGQRGAVGLKELQVAHAVASVGTVLRVFLPEAAARPTLMRASRSAAGSSAGSCGTRRPAKASFRTDWRRAAKR